MNRKDSFEKKLGSYALAGAAVLAAPALSNATIITQLNVNQTVNQTGSYSLNLSGASSADITISAELDPYTGLFNNVDASSVATAGVLLDTTQGVPSVGALAFEALIDPTATANYGTFGKMSTSFPPVPGEWSSTGASSYLGFYFTDASGVHAGWADIATTNSAAGSSFEILSYAYETTVNQSITAGQTTDAAIAPEPASMALLALGGVGLLAYRRRRSANA